MARIWTTPGSSPYAAWWIARSPSLSWKRLLIHKVGCVYCKTWHEKGLLISLQLTYKEYITHINKHIKIIMNFQDKVKWNVTYSLFWILTSFSTCALCLKRMWMTSLCPFWLAAWSAVWPANTPLTSTSPFLSISSTFGGKEKQMRLINQIKFITLKLLCFLFTIQQK